MEFNRYKERINFSTWVYFIFSNPRTADGISDTDHIIDL